MYGFLDKTRMQAINFIDQFLRKVEGVEDSTLQLIGISSIILAVKLNEDRYLTFMQGANECGNFYSTEMIEKTEKHILCQLEFQTNLPTTIEFI
jgi:hypothetical protein